MWAERWKCGKESFCADDGENGNIIINAALPTFSTLCPHFQRRHIYQHWMKMIIDLDFTSQYRSHKDKHDCYCIWRAKWGLRRRIEKLKISTSGTWCSVTPVLLLVSWPSQLGMYSEIEHLTCAWKCEFPQAHECSRWQEDSFLLKISTFMNTWELEFWNKLFRNVWALVCHIELNCIFISPKPECITQQNYTASKKYDPRCSSIVIASLPWLVPEGKVRWRGVQGPLHSIGS